MAKKQPKKETLVEVQWVDAECSSAGWAEYDKVKDQKEEITKSYGLLVDKGKNFVVLSECHSSENTWSTIQKIPNGMVRKIKVIAKV